MQHTNKLTQWTEVTKQWLQIPRIVDRAPPEQAWRLRFGRSRLNNNAVKCHLGTRKFSHQTTENTHFFGGEARISRAWSTAGKNTLLETLPAPPAPPLCPVPLPSPPAGRQPCLTPRSRPVPSCARGRGLGLRVPEKQTITQTRASREQSPGAGAVAGRARAQGVRAPSQGAVVRARRDLPGPGRLEGPEVSVGLVWRWCWLESVSAKRV